MSNLCSIHHGGFDKLYNLTGNYNQATLLDKLIYWWQISTYTLDDDQIWFTRSIEQIANDSKLSRRSVERYLQEFEANGLILKVSRLFMKKHLYIRISDQLQNLLGAKSNPTKNNTGGVEPYIKKNTSLSMIEVKTNTHAAAIVLKQDNIQEATTPSAETHDNCFIINQYGVIDSAKLAVSIYKLTLRTPIISKPYFLTPASRSDSPE